MPGEISADSMSDVYNFVKANREYQFIFAAVGAALAIGLARILYEKLRIRKIKRLAETSGLSYEESPQFGFSLRGLGPALFRLGDYSSETHGLKDISALPGAWYLDYQYTVRGGRSSRSYNFGLALYRGGGLNLPAFELVPETLLGRAGDLLTKRDIDLPGQPGFSRRYALTGPDRERIMSVFTPETASVLERLRGDWRVQADGGCLIAFKKGRVAAGAYPAFIEEARAIFRAFLENPGSKAAAGAAPREAVAARTEYAGAAPKKPWYLHMGEGPISERREKRSAIIALIAIAAFLCAVVYAMIYG